MFAFFIISFLTRPLGSGPNGAATTAILGIAMAFFFNAVPELLYQGNTRSFALLLASARFMLAHPVVWLLPNLVFATAVMAAGGGLHFERPAEVLIAFGNTFSSPIGVIGLFSGLPLLGAAGGAVRAALRDGLSRRAVPRAGGRRRQRAAARVPGAHAPLKRFRTAQAAARLRCYLPGA